MFYRTNSKLEIIPIFGMKYILCYRITDTIGPTETSIAPRQRPKANSTTATPSMLAIQSSATPIKVPAPSEFGNHRPKGNIALPTSSPLCLT